MWLPALEGIFKKILTGILESPSINFVISITSRCQQFPCYKNGEMVKTGVVFYFISEPGLFLGF